LERQRIGNFVVNIGILSGGHPKANPSLKRELGKEIFIVCSPLHQSLFLYEAGTTMGVETVNRGK
jgi:hypothetical protein